MAINASELFIKYPNCLTPMLTSNCNYGAGGLT
jgi:hypothetical protein